MLLCINVEFRGLKLQMHFSQDVLFMGYNIFLQVIELSVWILLILYFAMS